MLCGEGVLQKSSEESANLSSPSLGLIDARRSCCRRGRRTWGRNVRDLPTLPVCLYSFLVCCYMRYPELIMYVYVSGVYMEVSRVCGGIAPVRQRRESGEHGAHAHRCEVQHGVLQGVLARECQCDCPIERGCIVCRGRSFEESRGAVCARWVSNPALRRAEALPAAKPPSVCECVKRRAIISTGD